MKILYGVQGTGNGHISRARSMATEFNKLGVEVDYLFTSKPKDKMFDMECFGNYKHRTGLTFVTNDGKIKYLKTAAHLKPIQFIHDVMNLNIAEYDLIISDYEPITAWAGRYFNVDVVGIGHQYAFNCNIPKQGNNMLTNVIMKYFAPTSSEFGLHWHHFNQPILPPIVEQFDVVPSKIDNKFLVYLGFENTQTVIDLLEPFTDFDFHIYTSNPIDVDSTHITCNPLSKDKFTSDLLDCRGIITNSGFELVSEALTLGKQILVKPIIGQMEQESNAAALEYLNYGDTMSDLNSADISKFLNEDKSLRVVFPNVAKHLAHELCSISQINIDALWNSVEVIR